MLRSILPLSMFVLLHMTTSAPARAPVHVRILSWNIHHGEGTDGQLDLERIARVITSVNPDIVALQEVDRNCTRTGQVDQPAELARLTGLKVVFEKNVDLQGGEYGNALLTRWPVVRHQNHHLPNRDNGEQRGALFVELAVPQSQAGLTFIATHLDHRKPDEERLASAEFINALVLPDAGRSFLIAGDLNATPDSAVLTKFLEKWTNTTAKSLPTIPSDKPSRQIDFIMMRRAGRWKTVECRVLDEAVASDHRAIFAELMHE